MRKGLKSPFFKDFKNQHRLHIESQMKTIQEALGPDNVEALRACKEYVYSTNLHVTKKKGFSGSFSTSKGKSLLKQRLPPIIEVPLN